MGMRLLVLILIAAQQGCASREFVLRGITPIQVDTVPIMWDLLGAPDTTDLQLEAFSVQGRDLRTLVAKWDRGLHRRVQSVALAMNSLGDTLVVFRPGDLSAVWQLGEFTCGNPAHSAADQWTALLYATGLLDRWPQVVHSEADISEEFRLFIRNPERLRLIRPPLLEADEDGRLLVFFTQDARQITQISVLETPECTVEVELDSIARRQFN